MKSLKLNIHIDKSCDKCFNYTLDSKNTPKYFNSMKKEISSEIPPKLGTILKNTYDGINYDIYEIVEYENGKTFTLSNNESTYHVKYTFTPSNNGTDFEYYEWVEVGQLDNPTTYEVLERLKESIEQE